MAIKDLGLKSGNTINPESFYLFTGQRELISESFTPIKLVKEWQLLNPGATVPAAISKWLQGADSICACVLMWEKVNFLKAEFRSTTRAKSARTALNNPLEHFQILSEVIGTPSQLPPELGTTKSFVTVTATAAQALQIQLGVNATDPGLSHQDTVLLDEQGEITGLKLQLMLEIYVGGATRPAATFEIPVHLIPGERPKPYTGIVALDVGNTRSVLLCMNNEKSYQPKLGQGEPFEMFHLDADKFDPTVLSAVRIAALEPPVLDRYCRADYTIGQNALRNVDGLIVSPKRIVADPRKQEPYEFTLHDKTTRLPKCVPAELYVARLLQGFIRRKNQVPQEIRISYPTTYSLREIDDLRRAVYDALRQVVGSPNRLPLGSQEQLNEHRKKVNKAVPEPLDEASAAASYLLFRDFVCAPGSIRTFIDLYPRGLNVLVYDCGGGTTDITLVRAVGECHFDAATKKEMFTLRLENRARTGHRRFGGDEITLAVFRLVKLKIAIAVAKRMNLPDQELVALKDKPLPVADHSKWIALKKILPTEWMLEPAGTGKRELLPGLSDANEREKLVLALWDLAESVKRAVSAASNAIEGVSLDSQKGTWLEVVDSLYDHLVRSAKSSPSDSSSSSLTDDLKDELGAINVSRAEVDLLVRPLVIETVDKINRLMELRLPDDEQVGRIYVVGNASRYPLIAECLKDGLEILFARDKLRQEDVQTKLAVAKGACINAWLMKNHEFLTWEADRDVMHRLPYDVVLGSLGAGQPEVLYAEGTHIEKLPERLIPVPPRQGDRQPPTKVTLYRQWPGDTSISEFMVFDFGTPLRGPVRVTFDRFQRTFLMQDMTGPRIPGTEVISADYVPHVQSGLI